MLFKKALIDSLFTGIHVLHYLQGAPCAPWINTLPFFPVYGVQPAYITGETIIRGEQYENTGY